MEREDEFSAGTPRDDRGPCRAHDCGKEGLSRGIRSGDTLPFVRKFCFCGFWDVQENFILTLEHKTFLSNVFLIKYWILQFCIVYNLYLINSLIYRIIND